MPILAKNICTVALETDKQELPVKLIARGIARCIKSPDRLGRWVVAYDQADQADRKVVAMLFLSKQLDMQAGGIVMKMSGAYVANEHRRQNIMRGLLFKEWIARAQTDPDVIGTGCTVSKSNVKSQRLMTSFGLQKSTEDHEFFSRMFLLRDSYPEHELDGTGVKARTATLADLSKLRPLIDAYCEKMSLNVANYTRAMELLLARPDLGFTVVV